MKLAIPLSMQASKSLQVVSDDGDMIILFDRTDGSFHLGFRSVSMTQTLRFATRAVLMSYMQSL